MRIVISPSVAMGEFGIRLDRMMRERGLNQVELSRKSGVSQSLISKYIRSDPYAKYPSYPTLVKLAKALNCDLHDLTGLERLKGTTEPPDIDPEALALYDYYQSLPDSDSFKQVLRQKIEEMAKKNREEGVDGDKEHD